MIFYWFFYDFVEIDVFEVKPVPRRFGDEIWPKMTPTWGPKTTPRRLQNSIFLVTNFQTNFDAIWMPLGVPRGGGPDWGECGPSAQRRPP